MAVGDAQVLGNELNYGGPYVGFLAIKSGLIRKMPGRVVGQTVDKDGNRCYCLTLQTREQHVRREKATSNICSNQGLCALNAAIYMATMVLNTGIFIVLIKLHIIPIIIDNNMPIVAIFIVKAAASTYNL